MECPICGKWAPADRETGYDADDLCPECKDEGWTWSKTEIVLAIKKALLKKKEGD